MSEIDKKFEDVGDIKSVKIDVPHEAKKNNSYERHHKAGHNHVDRSERHPNSHHVGGKNHRTERDPQSHAFRKPKHEAEDGVRVEKKIADLMGVPKEQVTKLITEGKIKVNNVVVNDMSLKVTFEDEIHVNNRIIPNKRIPLKVYIFNKPKGYIVSNNDPQGRQTIFEIIPSKLGKLITVGRLDFNSEGLMLLTNNGDFARMMELPATGVQRQYRVRVFGDYNMSQLQNLKNGIEISGVQYGSIFIEEEKEGKEESANKWLKVTLYEGKNREIRNVMEYFGLQVNRLIRMNYGKYNLGTLPSGCVMEVKPIANPGGRARDKEYPNDRAKSKSRFGNIGKKPFKTFKPRAEEVKVGEEKPIKKFYKAKKPFSGGLHGNKNEGKFGAGSRKPIN